MTDDAREAAIKRLNDKRSFWQSLVGYGALCAVLVVAWALSGAGYFWPGWVIGFGGLAVLTNAWRVFGQKPITEAEIQREMRRGGDV